MSKLPNCLVCKKQLTHSYNKRCKSHSKQANFNPMFIDGNRIKPKFCLDCSKKITSNNKAVRCVSCHWKKTNSGTNNPMYGRRGKLCPSYKNGYSKIASLIRGSFEYRDWRKKVFERDNYTCLLCNVRGGKLNAHHLKSFRQILIDNNIKTVEQAMKCSELFDLSNGQTLCVECHKTTDTYLKSNGSNQYVVKL